MIAKRTFAIRATNALVVEGKLPLPEEEVGVEDRRVTAEADAVNLNPLRIHLAEGKGLLGLPSEKYPGDVLSGSW